MPDNACAGVELSSPPVWRLHLMMWTWKPPGIAPLAAGGKKPAQADWRASYCR